MIVEHQFDPGDEDHLESFVNFSIPITFELADSQRHPGCLDDTPERETYYRRG